uniref:Uncharacterized protein n=1 Tax=Rhizophora mucronata TaxID=61149 RepID=A0A2P2PSC7_RHIMU
MKIISTSSVASWLCLLKRRFFKLSTQATASRT